RALAGARAGRCVHRPGVGRHVVARSRVGGAGRGEPDPSGTSWGHRRDDARRRGQGAARRVTAYFERLDERRFLATEHTGGAWDLETQHIAPALGLLAHVVETDRDARRDDGLVLARVSYDILGTVPIAEVDVDVQVLRKGRTIELVEAVLGDGGRTAVR